jgi:hypothetical protein
MKTTTTQQQADKAAGKFINALLIGFAITLSVFLLDWFLPALFKGIIF